ncbi:MAG: nucleotidyltransferase domain-containing protein [Acetatifactor sp.]|nr:nucleotidyltransferase domain-containing protein [Acetatifactor sp.]
MVKTVMERGLIKVVLYGSCARGDYTQDSDIDIALVTACDRLEAKSIMTKLRIFPCGIQ